MAEVANVSQQFGFSELAKRVAPGDKNLLDIMEAMERKKPMLLDIPWRQCNQLLSEKIVRRSSVPTSGSWRQAYKGVTKQASTTQPVTIPVALLETRSEVDEDIIDSSPDREGTRRSEDIAFTEGMAQQMEQAVIDGTPSGNPERFDGLYSYLGTLNSGTTGTMVIDGGNAGGTSIIAVDWSFNTTYGIYPSAAANRGRLGLEHRDKGKEKVFDADSNPFYAYVSQFKWWVGLVVRDEFAIGRYCNISPTLGAANSFNEDKLLKVLELGSFDPARTVLYARREILLQMRVRLKDKCSHFDVGKGLDGRPVLTFWDCPVKRCDSISVSESTVS